MNREKAWEILNAYTKNPALIRHGLCVEAAMRHYAKLNGEDEEELGIAGLIHDFDYERWSQPPEHTREGAKVLRDAGFSEEVIGAMLSHVPWTQDEYPRDRPIRKTLYACDELCGFIHACALVRPTRIVGMQAKSVTKKMKDNAFAAAVSREDIKDGAELLEIPLADHVTNCIEALHGIAKELDLLPPDN